MFSHKPYQSFLLRYVEALLGNARSETGERRICKQIQMVKCKPKREIKVLWELEPQHQECGNEQGQFESGTFYLMTSRLKSILLFYFSFSSLWNTLLDINCMFCRLSGLLYIQTLKSMNFILWQLESTHKLSSEQENFEWEFQKHSSGSKASA